MNGHVAQARGDHDPVGAQRAVRGSHHPAVALPVDALDLDPDADVELVKGRIERQILGDAVARRPLAEPARDRVARQAREPAHRVQVQPVVAARPDRADLGTLEHDDVLARARELGGRRKPGRTGADHRDHTVVLHHRAAPVPTRRLSRS